MFVNDAGRFGLSTDLGELEFRKVEMYDRTYRSA